MLTLIAVSVEMVLHREVVIFVVIDFDQLIFDEWMTRRECSCLPIKHFQCAG